MNEKEVQAKKNEIIDMVRHIENEKFIRMIYGFVNRLYKEEKAGN